MKEKYLKFFAIFFLGIFCSFIFQTIASEHKKPKPNYTKTEPNFKLSFHGTANPIDGDSIKVSDDSEVREVRLFGIDAPEYHQNCFDAKDKEYACGKMSQKFLVNLINNKEVICYYSKKDVYNRYLAQCELAGISINQEILKNGMAIIYDYTQSNSTMKELEKSASTNKLGIWQGKFQKPKDFRKSHPYKKATNK